MNEQAARELIDMAKEVADNAEDSGDEISYLDVLDYLASTGLTLTRDLVGLASDAYQLEMRRLANVATSKSED